MDKVGSDRLNILRFPLIMGVVFIHAYGSNINLKEGSTGVEHIGFWAQFIQDFISNGLAGVVVPLFFILSGYLFFLGFAYSVEKCQSKIKARFKTLVIPFIFWNTITILLLFIAQTIPSTSVFFSGSKQLISTYDIYDFLNSLLGLTEPPIAYQFWFIRDLIIMVFLAPIITLMLAKKSVAGIFLVCLFALWFSGFWPIYIPSIVAFFFFYVGAYLARNKCNLFAVDKYGKFILCIYFFILVIDCLTREQLLNGYIHKMGVLFGIATTLYLSKLAYENKTLKNGLLKLSCYSFFVFAVHEPALTILKKLAYKTIEPSSDLAVTILYLAMPLTIIFLAVIAYKVLNRLIPKTLSIMCGGR